MRDNNNKKQRNLHSAATRKRDDDDNVRSKKNQQNGQSSQRYKTTAMVRHTKNPQTTDKEHETTASPSRPNMANQCANDTWDVVVGCT